MGKWLSVVHGEASTERGTDFHKVKVLKYTKTTEIVNFSVLIYAKVCKVYFICLIWLRDFENARAGLKVILIVRFIFC